MPLPFGSVAVPISPWARPLLVLWPWPNAPCSAPVSVCWCAVPSTRNCGEWQGPGNGHSPLHSTAHNAAVSSTRVRLSAVARLRPPSASRSYCPRGPRPCPRMPVAIVDASLCLTANRCMCVLRPPSRTVPWSLGHGISAYLRCG